MTENTNTTYGLNGFEVTQNMCGFMHQLNEISQAFIDFADKAPGMVVDMGVAYGIATLPILEKKVTVYACDLEQKHLSELAQRVDPSLSSYLVLKQGYFPEDYAFPEKSVGAILLSHILHFLPPKEMDVALDKIVEWLAPNGKVFIIAYAPYLAAVKDFIPLFEKRLMDGIAWPYWVENNMRDYFTAPPEIKNHVPQTMNYLDVPTLSNALTKRGLVIERAGYLDAKNNHIPQGILLDGREWCGIIASAKS